MSSRIYIEGAEPSEAGCREAFTKLLLKAGFAGRMPRLIASGGRQSTFEDFKTAHAQRKSGDFVAMLLDSEDAVIDGEQPWDHLKLQDKWATPEDAIDDQVFLMTTSMETWIVADRAALLKHYGHKLQESALPSLTNLERRNRNDVHEKLAHATRECSNAYTKGRRSFAILATVNPETLKALPSFARAIRILSEKLSSTP